MVFAPDPFITGWPPGILSESGFDVKYQLYQCVRYPIIFNFVSQKNVVVSQYQMLLDMLVFKVIRLRLSCFAEANNIIINNVKYLSILSVSR